MLAIGAGRQPTLAALGRCWPERLLYFPAVPVPGDSAARPGRHDPLAVVVRVDSSAPHW
jgi:hypothetical protein